MPTMKNGEKVTWKEFGKRWKAGMENVTPLQQAFITQLGQGVSGVGVIWGIIFSILFGYYWMAVILLGGLVVLGVQFLGNWQKKQIFKKMEDAMNQVEEVKGGSNV